MSFVPRTVEDMALDWPRELDHISASSVKMAARCPEQWRQRYVLHKKQPPAAALLAGWADHAAVERSMVQKIDTFVDLPTSEVQQFYVHALEERIEEAGGPGEIEIKDVDGLTAKKAHLDDLKVTGQEVVKQYHTTVSPYVQPLQVEKEFELTVTGLPVKVVGRQDLIAIGAPDVPRKWGAPMNGDHPRIIDRKRRTRAKPTPDPEWVIQAEVYQLADPLPHEWHLSVTTKTPKICVPSEGFYPDLVLPVRDPVIAETQLMHIVAEIGFFMRRYGPDAPWPTRGKLHTWACNYCGYRPDCWGWR